MSGSFAPPYIRAALPPPVAPPPSTAPFPPPVAEPDISEPIPSPVAWPAPDAVLAAPADLTAPAGLGRHLVPQHVALTDLRLAVLDVETSGLRPNRDRLLQVGLVRITAAGVEIDRFTTLLKAPWRPLRGRGVHGLSRRTLRGAPRFDAVMPELVATLDGHILCAHNIAFDWPFLRQALQRDGYEAPNALRLCTLQLSRSLDPERTRSHRLPDVYTRYGIPLERAHDTGADAVATAAVLVPLLAEAGVTDVAGLRPYLEGDTTAWPPVDPAQRHRWAHLPTTIDASGPLDAHWSGLADPLVPPRPQSEVQP